ncbi:baseplate J/gp47 family protein [Actinoplanes sp. NEAU-A12]|uniref:Baseplate J/gp47 family protein n=1 Tax=Actinoplanes sandaracinus TaxID=3045177 RepID=A0ABT6WWK5_9ACTN|nr:baseplate J/gp47 family protein [Actinoplanes sandaracinus]MDI6104126.1 baseplate J/gp47 family protein [Actinoplanes sandaracinus]
MIPGIDRRSALHTGTDVLGIDHLTVDPATQTTLDVHFLAAPSATQQALLTAELISIVATERDAPPVPVAPPVTFPTVGGEVVMRVSTVVPGGFGRYTLTIGSPLLDPYLASVEFSFKAGCPSDVDCARGEHVCGDPPSAGLAIDYQARDFWSMRTTLLDFAAQRYPRWADRLAPDAAVMLVEVMAALADEFAYHQDRVAREAHLETATQRRSLRRHARLVDYRIHDGLGADTWIAVTAAAKGSVPAGTALHGLRDGVRVGFSIGRNLDEMLRKHGYAIDPARNDTRLIPYQWDVHDVCLPVGSTSLSLAGEDRPGGGQAVADALKPFDDDPPGGDGPGRWVLLRTEPDDPALPSCARLVRVTSAEVVRDPLRGRDTVLLRWSAAQALTAELDLATLHVYGNVLPAVAGDQVTRTFVIGPGSGAPSPDALLAAESPPGPADHPADPPEPADPAWAIERTGPDGSTALLFSLYRTDVDGLVRRRSVADPGDPRRATPELRLSERIPDGAGGFVDGRLWMARASLLDAPASTALARDYLLDDGFWRRTVGYQRADHEFVHLDHAADAGVTIRFGDGTFGLIPARGTRFRVNYLVGNGRAANLPAGAIRHVHDSAAALIAAVENPFAVDNGVDPETPAEIRQLAPEAFRAVTFRAVRPEDYAEAAQRLDWVQRAGCSFRWTGSWQTAFVTPDPRSRVEVTAAERAELGEQLDRFRQAGRETSTLDPRYADLDLRIGFCVAPDAYAAEVKVRIAAVLDGFFAPDNFTFGTPLDRSGLEATIQRVGGVRAVEAIAFRRRGVFGWLELPASYRPGRNEVIRVENDALHPDRGSYELIPEGGA